VTRAARLLQAEADVRLGAEIAVRKKVPPGSGLGGGSSDAATVLLVLNRLWNCGLGHDDLSRLGRSLGADVPVFIRGRSALAMATGDKLQSCSLGLRHYVLVFPDFPIATRELFEDPDLKRDSRLLTLQEILSGSGRNDFEPLVRKRFPVFDETMRILQKWGKPVMTGTGSGIFIPMRDKKSAKSAARAIKSLYNVRAVQGVDLSPLHEKLD